MQYPICRRVASSPWKRSLGATLEMEGEKGSRPLEIFGRDCSDVCKISWRNPGIEGVAGHLNGGLYRILARNSRSSALEQQSSSTLMFRVSRAAALGEAPLDKLKSWLICVMGCFPQSLPITVISVQISRSALRCSGSHAA
jgi:hypothetical protein